MNKKIIEDCYERLIKKKDGCGLHKMDLHIHTPASKCYKRSLQSLEEEYIKILDTLQQNNISIAAITDHNSVKGYFQIKEILKERKDLATKYRDILLLPGIEISNFGKHILAIFPTTKKQEELDNFLYNIGIDVIEQGEEFADAYKVTPSTLLEEINKFGGVAILAHADSTNGLLEKLIHNNEKKDNERSKQSDIGWIQNGKSLTQVIKSSYLKGISINNRNLKNYLVRDILNNKQYRRDKSIPIIYCSDSHSTDYIKNKKADGKPIGERFSYIKLSEVSFEGLKLALEDPDVRIYENNEQKDISYIEGVAIRGGYLAKYNNYEVFRFNKELNCVIGARGTGKSTLLDIIQYTLSPNEFMREVIYKFDSSIVYLKYQNETYAFICEPQISTDDYTGEIIDLNLSSKVYKRNKSGTFNISKQESKKIIEEVACFSSVSYRQKDIYKYAESDDGPINIIDNLLLATSGLEYLEEVRKINILKKTLNDNVNKINKFELKNFLSYETEYIDEYKIEIINPYREIMNSLNSRRELRRNIIDKINKSLVDQVFLSISSVWGDDKLISNIVMKSRRKDNIVYEEQIWLKKILKKVFSEASKNNNWDFWMCILINDNDALVNNYNITKEEATKLIKRLRGCIDEEILLTFPEDKIEFMYNVNLGLANKMKLLDKHKLSLGQKAVAMLLIILKAGYDLGDDRPLIIDQPEDDLDNVYIYSSLVKEFREVKKSRQLIFATHNSNIPIAGDAENIMIMESDGERGYLSQNGSIDKYSIREKVLKILEGGKEALELRLSKYESVL